MQRRANDEYRRDQRAERPGGRLLDHDVEVGHRLARGIVHVQAVSRRACSSTGVNTAARLSVYLVTTLAELNLWTGERTSR